MKVFDINGNLLDSYDSDNGYLVEEQRLVQHHEAIPAVEEIGHYVTAKVYPNGGRDLKFVVDVPGTEAKDAWDEYETVGIYYEYGKDPEPDDDVPTQLDFIEAQVMYTALMTDTLLGG